MHPSHSSHGSISLGTFLAQNTLETEEGGRALLTFHRFTARTSGARGIPRARHSCRERRQNHSWQGNSCKGTDFPALPIPSCRHKLQGIGDGWKTRERLKSEIWHPGSSRIPLLIPGAQEPPGEQSSSIPTGNAGGGEGSRRKINNFWLL